MVITKTEHAAITFDRLVAFIAKVELGNMQHDVLHLRDLLCSSISDATVAHDLALSKFLIAALEFIHADRYGA